MTKSSQEKTRTELVREMTGPIKSKKYAPAHYAMYGVWGWSDEYPILTVAEIELMMRDEQVQFGLEVLEGVLSRVKWVVKSKSQKVADYVNKCLKSIWRHDLYKIMAISSYGSAGGEIMWKEEKGQIIVDSLRDAHLLDLRPMVDKDGKLGGVAMYGVEEAQGKVLLEIPAGGWWIAYKPRFNYYYGRSRLNSTWNAWKDKRGTHGAVKSRRLWFAKNAFNGGVLKYPLGTSVDEDGNILDNKQTAMQILEKMETGGVIALPNSKDEDGNPLWEYQPPTVNGDIREILQYPQDLDKEILKGLGIPPEVIEAGDTGSGYAGRAVPAMVFYASMDGLAMMVIETMCRQVIDWGVKANFGDIPYEVEPKSLIPQPEGAPGQGPPGQPQQPGPGNSGLSDQLNAMAGGQGEDQQGGGEPPPAEAGSADVGGSADDLVPYKRRDGTTGWKRRASGGWQYQKKRMSLDAYGHEHKGKGPGGGQFTGKGQGGGNGGDSEEDLDSDDSDEDHAGDYAKNGTRSRAFKAWFGDWENDPDNASKVVNPETGEPQETHEIPGTGSMVKNKRGKPVAVYHGTNRGGFDQFSKEKISGDNLFGPGFYFTEDESVAEEYTEKGQQWDLDRKLTPKDMKKVGRWFNSKEAERDAREDIGMRQHLTSLYRAWKTGPDEFSRMLADPELGHSRLREVLGVQPTKVEQSPEVKSVYLNIRNPFNMDAEMNLEEISKIFGYHEANSFAKQYGYYGGKWPGQLVYENIRINGKLGDKEAKNNALQQWGGYDGITHIGGDRMGGGHHHRVWIAFEPNQIKAVNNRGTFDPENPSIHMSLDLLPGGKGDLLADEDVDPYELRRGIPVEMEHTNDPAIAAEIDRDHQAEFPDLPEGYQYYDVLAGLEEKLKELKQAIEDGDTEKAEEIKRILDGLKGGEVIRMSLDPDRSRRESAVTLADQVIDRGAQAGIVVTDEIRRKVLQLLKKNSPGVDS